MIAVIPYHSGPTVARLWSELLKLTQERMHLASRGSGERSTPWHAVLLFRSVSPHATINLRIVT